MFTLNRSTRAVKSASVRLFSVTAKDKNYPVNAAKELFAATKKAGGDLYAPVAVAEKWGIATRNIPNFNSLLNHPLVGSDRRADFVADFAQHLKADAATVAFLKNSSVQGTLQSLPEVMTVYKKMVSEERNETIAVVTSAAPLSKEEVASIKKSLEKHVKKGNKLIVEQVVNPHILGGLSITMGNMHQDLTLATALTGYEEQLDKAVL